MNRRVLLVAIGLAVVTPVHAAELVANGAESVALGSFRGVVYYSIAPDGYRLIATIADGEAGSPVRFEATLVDRQRVVISVPRKLGEPSLDIAVSRVGEKVFLLDTPGVAGGRIGSRGTARAD